MLKKSLPRNRVSCNFHENVAAYKKQSLIGAFMLAGSSSSQIKSDDNQSADALKADLKEKIDRIEPLVKKLISLSSIDARIELLSNQPAVQEAFEKSKDLSRLFAGFTSEYQAAMLPILAIGEGPIVFRNLDFYKTEKVEGLFRQLIEVDRFYYALGGVAGYHYEMLTLILQQLEPNDHEHQKRQFRKPEGLDLTQNTLEVREAVVAGLEELSKLCEIYPVGGAGDRLNLKSESGVSLPAACLRFTGRTLLEGLIRDLQAREYLYFKLKGKQLVVPVVMMTSHEKDNHAQIHAICEEQRWFGRSPSSFFIFVQPLAPVITKEGHWSMVDEMKLYLKPNGHGVIWKLCVDRGAFNWLADQQKTKALIRQINNPIAGTDHGLLALVGLGISRNKAFGFASCPRMLNASEGMNVLSESVKNEGYEYSITNVEYTEFEKHGLKDTPDSENGKYSCFPANTNILFADLESIKKAVKKNSIPGMLCNLKTKAPYIDSEGNKKESEAGRLESTMQNIADGITNHFAETICEGEQRVLKTFLTYNKRSKTISVTKKSYQPESDATDTPEWCYYELLENQWDLLSNECKFIMPPLGTFEEYLKSGPAFTFLYHPALGPLYSIISQKVRKGSFVKGSELQLEISEVDIEELKLIGSLQIYADVTLGRRNEQDILCYSNNTGKCELYNVTVENAGIDYQSKNTFWKNEVARKERLRIHLHGDGEFYAKDVVFKGNMTIHVPDGCRMIALMRDGQVQYVTERIHSPSWHWDYALSKDHHFILFKTT